MARHDDDLRPKGEKVNPLSQRINDVRQRMKKAFDEARANPDSYPINEIVSSAVSRAHKAISETKKNISESAESFMTIGRIDSEDRSLLERLVDNRLEIEGFQRAGQRPGPGIIADLTATEAEVFRAQQALWSTSDRGALIDIANKIDPKFASADDIIHSTPEVQLERLREFILNRVDPDKKKASSRARAAKAVRDSTENITGTQGRIELLREKITDEMLEFQSRGAGEARRAKNEAQGVSYTGRNFISIGRGNDAIRWDPSRLDNLSEMIEDLAYDQADPTNRHKVFNPAGYSKREIELWQRSGRTTIGVPGSSGEDLEIIPRLVGEKGEYGWLGFARQMSPEDVKDALLRLPDQQLVVDTETAVSDVLGHSVANSFLDSGQYSAKIETARREFSQRIIDAIGETGEEPDLDMIQKRLGAAFNNGRAIDSYHGVTQLAVTEVSHSDLVGLSEEAIKGVREKRLLEDMPDLSQYSIVGGSRSVTDIGDLIEGGRVSPSVVRFTEELEGIAEQMRGNDRLMWSGLNTTFDVQATRQHGAILAARLIDAAKETKDEAAKQEMEMLARRLHTMTGRITGADERGGITFEKMFDGKQTDFDFIESKARVFDWTAAARRYVPTFSEKASSDYAEKYGLADGSITSGWKIAGNVVMRDELLTDDFLREVSDKEIQSLMGQARKHGRLTKASEAHELVNMIERETEEAHLTSVLRSRGVSLGEIKAGIDSAGKDTGKLTDLIEQMRGIYGDAFAAEMRQKMSAGGGYSADEWYLLLIRHLGLEKAQEMGWIGNRHAADRDTRFVAAYANAVKESIIKNRVDIAGKTRPMADMTQRVRSSILSTVNDIIDYTGLVGDDLKIPMIAVPAKESIKGVPGLRLLPKFIEHLSYMRGDKEKDAIAEVIEDTGPKVISMRWAGNTKKAWTGVLKAAEEVTAVMAKKAGREDINWERMSRYSLIGTGLAIGGAIAFKVGTDRLKQHRYDDSWAYDRNESWSKQDESAYNDRLDQAALGNLTLQTHYRRNMHMTGGKNKNRHLRGGR